MEVCNTITLDYKSSHIELFRDNESLTVVWISDWSLVSRTLLFSTTHCESESESESHVTTDGQPANLSWNKAPIWGLRPDVYYLCDNYGLVLVGRPL
jgi:hypothetical protein